MRFRRSSFARPLLALLAAAGLTASAPAGAETITIQGTNNPSTGNCIPFGGSTVFTNYFGFVYANIPPFTMAPGDVLAFDLMGQNEVNITVSLDLVTTTVNGGDVPDGAFTRVVTAGTAADPNGDTVVGSYELAYTVDTAFTHPGGGLIIRIERTGSFNDGTDPNCTGTLVAHQPTDPSGFFVSRIYSDADGMPPWSGSPDDVGRFELRLADGDGDGVLDVDDNCVGTSNAGQEDLDLDLVGDPCDPDIEGDGIDNATEEAAGSDPLLVDSDGDTIADGDEWTDFDGDGDIDAIDDDSDGDGALDVDEAGDDDLDTLPVDSDEDGLVDVHDLDSDNDGVFDGTDVCRIVFDPQQIDADGTGQGDACAGDDDGDGVDDGEDNCPQVANDDQADADSDDLGDACVADDDADGFLDGDDNCPVDANADQADFDADGLGDACDPETTGAGGSSGEGGSGPATTAATTTSGAGGSDEPADDGGCQVSQAGSGAGSWGAFVAAAAALLGLGARRKQR